MTDQNSSQAAVAAVSGQSTDAVIAERGRTHGDYNEMSRVQAGLAELLRSSPKWSDLTPQIQVFLLSTCQKLSRIVSGNPHEPDHYRDIGGYARLAEKSLASPAELEPTTIEGSRITTLSIDKLLVGSNSGPDLCQQATCQESPTSDARPERTEVAIPRDVLDGVCSLLADGRGENSVLVRDHSGRLRLRLDPRGLEIYNERGGLVLSSTARGTRCTTEMAAATPTLSGASQILDGMIARTGTSTSTGSSSSRPAEIVEAVVSLQKATENLNNAVYVTSDDRSRSRERIADNAIREIVAAIGRQVDKGRAEVSKLHEEKARSYGVEITALHQKNDELRKVIEAKDRVIDCLSRS